MVVLPLLVRLVNYCTSIICFVQEHTVKYMKKMRIILSEQTIYIYIYVYRYIYICIYAERDMQRGDWRRLCSPVFDDHGQDVKKPRGNGHEMNPTVVNVFLSAPPPPRFIYRNQWHEWFVPEHVLETRSNVLWPGAAYG